MDKLQVGIIGLGKFGLTLGATMTNLGHTVIGVDLNAEQVQLAREKLTQVYQADATDVTALKQLHFDEPDKVVVCVGDSLEQAVLTILALQELKVKEIYVKAANVPQKKVFMRLGVNQAILPAQEAAVALANRLINPGMIDLLPLGGGVLVQEVVVNKWQGKSLLDLKLSSRHRVIALALKRTLYSQEYDFVPNPMLPLDAGDRLVLMGRSADIAKLEP